MSAAVRWSAPELVPPPPPPEQRGLPSVEELQAIEEAARAEGYARGHAEGLASGQAEIRRIVAQMEGILDAFTRPLARLDAEVGDALGALAVRIAGALLGRSYAADPALLAALVREALEISGSETRQLELRLHPDDIAMLTPHLPPLDGVRLVPDLTLARGDLRVHADSVRIDGSLAARLNTALQSLAGEHA
ncbi:FliH/SctL family protein [Thermomonas haemolytica]|uniref:Flagellar assembly protein FliH n=1 Tax=Thermomonas haemolytica TaxID=141949 RepID=A0A4R3N2F6_9GAMM|nr:FliH/SctL family protein [Thermomonas haemolytica]TCT23268.1 flagellar assembly protein FliH [Thermomonas haemolytica]TNY30011.1 flagellar assembly protein FliH [Thermomonas haemolytica]